MKAFELHIEGRVQGVGFRPFIYNLAKQYHLAGSVRNTSSGVYIELQSDLSLAEEFIKSVKQNRPERAIIENISLRTVEVQEKLDFSIVDSDQEDELSVKISPDFAMCPNCEQELMDSQNRRKDYPFITCTICGPRYSIQNEIPYDRSRTTMSEFQQCPICQSEYDKITDRRFFSQTNSCLDCGVSLTYSGLSDTSSSNLIIKKAILDLRNGLIVAVKGIGGYLLLCDPSNEETLITLRKRKQRPDKPFALMYPDLTSIKKDVVISNKEVALLSSEISPIVLLERKPEAANTLCWKQIAPKLKNVGIMLPYAPLLKLISSGFGGPLIATSANCSGAPIVFQDDQASNQLGMIADTILSHNRKILLPQDDSVARFADHRLIWMRRSRGLAPSYFGSQPKKLREGVLALGAHMKSSFSISQAKQVHISQYLGSLDSYESQENYKDTLKHVQGILQKPIMQVLTDAHPGYFVNTLGQKLSNAEGMPCKEYQHHKAHFAAVLQENDLIDHDNVLGVIWDGTGWGDDHQLWGGEFFSYEEGEISRSIHFKYQPNISNDRMALEPRLSALSMASNIPEARSLLSKKFSRIESKNHQIQLNKPSMMTTSVGRLFDAVACILGLIDKSSFEGQAAMYLETCARSNHQNNLQPYPFKIQKGIVDTNDLLQAIVSDVLQQQPKSKIAARFHLSLVEIIKQVAIQLKITNIAFSGGVFQNSLLVKMIDDRLSSGFNLFFHKELPPNDENISFGQIALFHLQQEKKQASLTPTSYVSSNPW